MGIRHTGLPRLLGFQIQRETKEILMENAGPSLLLWQDMMQDQEDRMKFAVEMLA